MSPTATPIDFLPATAASRRLEPEIMDDPSLDPALHTAALRGLGRINRLSGSAAMLWPALESAYRSHVERRGTDRTFRVLDLACGGGDVTTALAGRAARCGMNLRITGADVSPVALGFARRHAETAGVELDFRQLDVLSGPLPPGPAEDGRYDVAMNSLFMHHLTTDQAIDVFAKMRGAAGTVLINDLRRSKLAYAFTVLGTRLITRSRVVHVDGPLSVRSAWTRDELLALAERAGLRGATVERRFPWRMLLRWSAGGDA
ncbi:MAG: methyltransferase domain-containing protein [Planctomycetota bacterium]